MDAWSSSYTMKEWKWCLRHGSAEGCTDLVGYIEYHKGSYAMEARKGCIELEDAMSTKNCLHRVPQRIPMPWNRGAIPTPWKCGKGSNTIEVRRVVLSWLAGLSTIKYSYALEVEKFLHHGSVEGITELVGRI